MRVAVRRRHRKVGEARNGSGSARRFQMGWTFIRETPYKTSEELIADELRPWTVVDMCSKPREDH